jgi:putative acetyltransferase
MSIEKDPRFTPWESGRFMARFGRLGERAPHSDTKLCLVATDPEFLIDLLYALSLREDCWYVTYGTVAREGMYLGRCWLETDGAVAELGKELKGHPRLMVSVQNDSLLRSVREIPIPAGSCGVWDAWPEHAGQVSEVHAQAFGRPAEAALVEAVFASKSATISLVAQLAPETRAQEPWPIVGHVLFSPVTIDEKREPPGLGLGPLAVLPLHQRKGFGTQLIAAGLRRARALGYAYIVVLGHPELYPRFGFAPASRFGLRYQRDVSDESFMALELAPGALQRISGVVSYLPAFSGA